MDANGITILGEQNAKCFVIEHLSSFDLGSATGSFGLVTGVHNDVLHVQCQTGFLIDEQGQSFVHVHTDLHHYFAKGKGVIFNHGIYLLLGNLYIIPEK